MAKKKSQTWSYVGVADDLGVYHVGGRMGASGGPDRFWSVFQRMTGDLRPLLRLSHSITLRDWAGSNVEHLHESALSIREAHQKSGTSIIVGGGHDHGAAHLAGIKDALKPRKGRSIRLGCINIDAHLDLRKPEPEITSGSPFYVAIENKWIRGEDLVEFGIQSQCNGPALWDYARKKKIRIIPYSDLRRGRIVEAFKKELRKLEKQCDAIVISLDLDALAQAFSPGVSAPQSEGFSSSEVIEMIQVAAESNKTVSLGIFELNPIYDLDDRSARLAATVAYRWLEAKLPSTPPKSGL